VMKVENRHILPLPEGRGFTRKCISVPLCSFAFRVIILARFLLRRIR
jgi:hypothetical protein